MRAPTASLTIDDRILDAVLGGRIAPGTRLIEQKLAAIFDVSRTRVREALMRLQAHGVVEIRASRGWFVVEPSIDSAREAFEARRAIEVGLLHCISRVDAPAIALLKAHLDDERRAIAQDNVSERSFLLGDFHVCMAEALGNSVLAGILRALTARTMLIAMLYQSTHDASASCTDHVHIVDALEAGDFSAAAARMGAHIDAVERALDLSARNDPITDLREALLSDLPAFTEWSARASTPSSSIL